MIGSAARILQPVALQQPQQQESAVAASTAASTAAAAAMAAARPTLPSEIARPLVRPFPAVVAVDEYAAASAVTPSLRILLPPDAVKVNGVSRCYTVIAYFAVVAVVYNFVIKVIKRRRDR